MSASDMRELRAENAQLRETLQKFESLANIMAAPSIDVLKESGAPNYVEVLLTQEEETEPSIVLTIQRIDGLSPHQMRARVKQELYEVTDALTELWLGGAGVCTGCGEENKCWVGNCEFAQECFSAVLGCSDCFGCTEKGG